jgi:hypothetical protein
MEKTEQRTAKKKCLNCMEPAETCHCAEGPNFYDLKKAREEQASFEPMAPTILNIKGAN